RPALRALAGLPGDGRVHCFARLSVGQEMPPGLTVYLRVRIEARPGAGPGLPWAVPLRTQRSGDLASLAGADALAVLPAGRPRLRRGTVVEAILLRAPARSALSHDP
ncbi:MAG TPA: hypothetical protein VFG59_03150, partial [Anaeromyxobacter sp.]|nr:hypothetical protein [Anaeromyxobacter sp.]